VSKFCEAIVEYMANISSAPDPNVQIESFSGEVCSAWEIFFTVWLGSKEAKVNVWHLYFLPSHSQKLFDNQACRVI